MKNIGDKLQKVGKSIKDSARKYALLGALAVGCVAYANGQDFDRSKLAGMDFYSSSDFAKDSSYVINNDWNSLNYSENRADAKVAKAKERIPEYLDYMKMNIDCEINSKILSFNFAGIENFESYEGFDNDNDGIKEGRDYYKDKIKFGVGAENIPFYEAVTTTIDGIIHKIPCFFKGSNNKEIKDNPLDFNQWYFFDYLTGNEIKPGNYYMNADKNVEIQWIGWRKDLNSFENHTIIPFYFNNGIASYNENELFPDILKENPHQLYVKGQDEEISVERGIEEPDLSVEKYGLPIVESNAEFNKPVVSLVSSEFVPFDSCYPEYGVMKQKFKGEINIGRWNGKNLEALVDTMERKIMVDDTTLPEVTAPEDVNAGYNADMGLERMGSPVVTDASPYPLETWFEDNEISNDGRYKVIERTHFAKDVRGNVGSDVQKITLDLTTGIDDYALLSSFKLYQNYPNPANSSTIIEYFSTGGNIIFQLTDLKGKNIKTFRVNNSNSGNEMLEINFGVLTSGIYIFSGQDEKGNSDKIKLIIKRLQ